jgi:3-oxoacyl-[acyl-carrier-protein] synthase-1
MTFYLNHCGVVCALGDTHAEIKRRLLFDFDSGVATTDAWSPGRMLTLGCVSSALPDDAHLPLAQRSRNNRMALAALAQIRPQVDAAIARHGAGRIGIVVGTSTSGIASTEAALRLHAHDGGWPDDFHYAQQEMGSPALMLARELGVSGPAYVHSSACASSAKALASAARLIKMGVCDAVVTGGVDTLCGFTVAGFSALESVSAERSNPFSAQRNGINIGEGAALFLMTAQPDLGPDFDPDTDSDSAPVALYGWGESSDGHHMSAPDPAGSGARLAIAQALCRAGIGADQIDYINLHGTGTRQNDAMEARVIHDLFGPETPVSSTKPCTGHALGAAGAIEAALCWLAMQDDNSQGRLPPQLWNGVCDPALPAVNLVRPGALLGRPLRWALSNSFAFGGSNAVLVLGRTRK